MVEAINYYFDKYFHVITAFVILLVLLFFSADQVIGAAGLRAIYPAVGTGFGIGCLIWLVLVFRHNQMTGNEKLTAALIVVGLIGAPIFIKALAPVAYLSLALGWITSVLTGAIVIPPYAIAALMVMVVILQIVLTLTGSTSAIRKTISTLLLIYMAGFSMGLASLPRYGLSVLDESYSYDNHQYLLYIQL